MTDTLATPAALAATTLHDVLKEADRKRTAHVSDTFPGADVASVTLAARVADVLAGTADKGKGSTAQKVNDVIRDVDADTATPADYVLAARAVLDARKQAAKVAREELAAERKVLKDAYNANRGTLAAGQEAASKLATFDYEATIDKKVAAREGFLAALTRAANAGIDVYDVIEAVQVAYKVEVTLASDMFEAVAA